MKESKAKIRASHFLETRKTHSHEAAEDYTEIIYDLINSKTEAKIVDIAKHLGISHVTAIRTIKRLQDEGYLTTSYKKPVELTKKGLKLAKYSKERHKILIDFFINIGVPQKIAEIDVEGIEHHVSKTTLKHIKNFLNKKI